jgi:hypothetical protein
MSEAEPIAVIGAGPAGLIAAELLSAAGKRVVVYERMPSVARKFLMAGRGGLNLTHAEPFGRLIARYGEAADKLRPMLEAFTPNDLRAWADALGAETFIGSSGRVFPRAMKASPLLRAWLSRLTDQGVEFRLRSTWLGWSEDGALRFAGDEPPVRAAATLLALGGASWPRLGSDGSWREVLLERGVAVAPFRPANAGFNVAWSEHFRTRFAGQPLKTIALRCGDAEVRGEAMVTNYGLEGGAIYALSSELRARVPITVHIDLRPALSIDTIAAKLSKRKPGDTLSSRLRKTLGLSPVAIGLIYEAGPPPRAPDALAALIKSVPVALVSSRGLDRAISTAGGVSWDAVDQDLQLRAIPNVYVAGEMLDWEAPTGGYLLQACFATGVRAARAMLRR